MSPTRTRNRQTVTFENDHGAVVATIVKAGDYHVRCYVSPDEFDYSKWATLDAAENVAMRHALRMSRQPEPHDAELLVAFWCFVTIVVAVILVEVIL